jgi:hypothetical protein
VLRIYTGEVGKYRGPHGLDVTARSGDPVFAPSWEIVMGSKSRRITRERYIAEYERLLRGQFKANLGRVEEVLSQPSVVLLCYCDWRKEFCHRRHLATVLKRLADRVGIGAEIMGEVSRTNRPPEE